MDTTETRGSGRGPRYNDGWPWWVKHAGHARRALVTATRGSVIILMYHRVTDTGDDPLDLAIDPAVFEAHIASFSASFQIVPLKEVVSRLREGKRLPARALCLTFDDGYLDNLTHALPVLTRYNAPATFFVAGAGLGDPSYRYEWELREPRAHAHLDAAALVEASQDPRIEIGGHTQTHPHLARLSAQEQCREISENARVLEDLTGEKPRLFAYPFGGPADLNEESVRAVRACGYEAAVTTSSGFVSKGIDLYRLPREDVSLLSAADATAYLRHAFGG